MVARNSDELNLSREDVGSIAFPRQPVIFSDDDWDVQSLPHSTYLKSMKPFSEGDWIPRN